MDKTQSNPDHFSQREKSRPQVYDDWVDENVTVDERTVFRKVFFGSEEGLQVWTWLMMNLGYFKPIFDEKGAILRNFALELQTVLGLTSQEHLEMMIRNHKEVAESEVLDVKSRDEIRRMVDGRSSRT